MFGLLEFSSALTDTENKHMAAIRAGNSFFEQVIRHRQRLGKCRKVTAWIIEMGDVIRRGTVRQSPASPTFCRGYRDLGSGQVSRNILNMI